MGKKKVSRKLKARIPKRSHVKHYLQVFIVGHIAAVLIFIGIFFLVNKQPDCANTESCKAGLIENIDNKSIGYFQGRQVIPPKIDPDENNTDRAVLGTSEAASTKHIYVDLSTQRLYAYEGTEEFMQTLVATGRWGRTPAGNFNIWTKLRATRMSGGSGADYYNLPNVPSVMYFYGDFGIHGAYWHNNFGHTMSHGCVNMRLADAKTLFDWAEGPESGKPGTAVSVCDKFNPPDNCQQENPVR